MKKKALLVSIIGILSVTGMLSCSKRDPLFHSTPEAAELGVRSGKVKIKELAGNPNVDIIWVIDNSGSMGEEQQDVIKNTAQFVDRFTIRPYIRWKLGILSSDVYNLKKDQTGFDLGKEMTWNVADSVKRFKDGVGRLSTGGSATERFFDPVVEALSTYPDFLSPNSLLVVIFVTDAIEQSQMSAKEFLQELYAFRNPDQIRVYGVLGNEDLGCTNGEGEGPYKGLKFEEVINTTKGKVFPICSKDFGDNLVTIADDIVKLLQNPRILLKKRPMVNTIRVFYKDQELKGGPQEDGGVWTYDYEMNAIIFYTMDFAPEDDAQVEVVYDEDNGWN